MGSGRCRAIRPAARAQRADARDGRGGGRRLPADGLQRAEQPRAAAPGHPGAGPGGHRDARLLAEPGGPQPAHPLLAPGRAARRPGRRGQRQRADGPVRALARGEHRGRGLPRPAVHRRRRRTRRPGPTTSCSARRPSTPSSSPTPSAATRTPPGSTEPGRAVRRLRPAVGRARRAAPLGRRGRPRRRRAAVDHLVERGHSRIAWVGWQKGSFIGEDRRSGWVDRMHERGLSTSRLSARGDDTLEFGAARGARPARRRRAERPTAFVCASDTLAMGVLRALDELGPAGRARDVAVVGFDDSIAPRWHARPDLGPAAAGAGRGRDRALPRRAPRAPADPRARLRAHPDADGARGRSSVRAATTG